MKHSLFLVQVLVLASLVDLTRSSPTGCICYNPLLGTSQEDVGDPQSACLNTDQCFVRCDGTCSDMTKLSGGIFAGKCRSESACHRSGEVSSSCYCGLTSRLQFIVGGSVADENEYPWQVGFVLKGETDIGCGGSLISDMWVLTAAHCTQAHQGHTAETMQVLLGLHDTANLTKTNTIRSDLALVVNHPHYRKGTIKNNDFSLVKLATKIVFAQHEHIRPICLPEDDSKDYAGTTATVSGWGAVEEGGKKSRVLMEVEVMVLSDESCRNDYKYKPSEITDEMVCASVEGGGQDSCQGDSGGPLVSAGSGDGVSAGQNYELVGVVSWGAGCANADYPGVYARVNGQLGWIAEVTAKDWSTCPRE